jgi:hypothetical protein
MLKFDRVILCGAIVRRDYPWSQLIDHGLVRRVLNEFGRLDLWARVVEWLASDAGQSGLRGFNDTPDGRVVQREHPEFGHSDYFYSKNFRERWIPFLRGEDPNERPAVPKPRPNWRARATAAVLLVTAIAVAAFSFYNFRNVPPGRRPIQTEESVGAELGGFVKDAVTGQFLEGVELSLKDYDDIHGQTPSCRTDREGRFRFRDLPASSQLVQRVRLVARKTGYVTSDTYTSLGQDALPIALRPEAVWEHDQ